MSIRSEFVRLWNEFMAGAKKISELPDASTPLAGTEQVELNQGGTSVKTAVSNLPGGGGGSATWGGITGTLSAQTDLQAALDLKESLYRPFDRKTSNYPLVLADASRGIEMNMAGANTVTVPLNATQAFPIGTLIPVVQYGAGLTSIVATGGVTINTSAGNLDSPGQYAPMFLRKIATDEWYLWNGTAGGGGIDDVLAEAQALTDDRDITIGDHVYRETADDGTLSSQVQIDPSALGFTHNEAAGSAILSLDSEGIRVADTIENRGLKGQANFSANIQANDFAQKNYVDNLVAGLKWKTAVRVATTNADSGSLSNAYENGDTIDGVVLVTGDRILIKDQADSTEDGIYIVAASGTPSRATDADTGIELEAAVVSVEEGTENGNTTWRQNADNITLGVTNIDFQSFGTSSPDASETVKGIIELATQAEVTTGTDDVRAVTPLKLATALTDYDFILAYTLRNTFNY